jgi:glycosyltransferase 2 family protein
MAGKKHRVRKYFSPFLLIRLIGIGFFIYILLTVDISGLWLNMKEVRTDFLLYGIFFQVLLLFLKAIRWHVLNKGTKTRNEVFRSFGEFFESYAIGVITPGRLGEMVKAGHAREKNRIMETGIRVVVERGFDLGIFLFIAGVAFWMSFSDPTAILAGIMILLVGTGVLLLAFLFMVSPKATKVAEKMLNSFPFLKLNLQLDLKKRKPLSRFLIIILSVASNFSYFISCYFLAAGLLFSFSFLYISGAVAIAGLLNMLPVTIMGLGTREGTFLLMFKPLSEPLILAFSGLVFLVAQIGGGLLSLLLGQFFLFLSGNRKI